MNNPTLNVFDDKSVPVQTTSNLKFQIIVDSKNILLGMTPNGGKMRAIITELDAKELSNIVQCVADAGPEAMELLSQLVNNYLNCESKI